MRNRFYRIGLVVVVLGLMLTGLVVPAVRESQTQDEAVYVVAGLSYWRTGDFRLNPEHPPLLKQLMSLPLLAQGATFDPVAPDWAGASQWDIAPKVLYQNVRPGADLLLSARLVNVWLTLALVIVAAWLAWRTFGPSAAGLTLVLLAIEPSVLANGHLATTDVGYTLALLGSLFSFGWWMERPSGRRAWLAAGCFSLALLTRFNALLLVGLLPMLYVTVMLGRRGHWRSPAATLWRTAGIFAITAVVMTWLAYGFEVRPLNEAQDEPARRVLSSTPAISAWLERTPLPSMSYISGLLFQVDHNRAGQWGYLFGAESHNGWWYYFVAALAVKLTIGFVLLAVIGMVAAIRKNESGPGAPVFSVWYLAVAIGVLLISSFPSQLPLGVRYVLPAIVLSGVVAGAAVHLTRRHRWVGAIVGLLAVGHIVSVARYFPHWLPYANEAFGGAAALDHHLIDSNLDWGQDMPLVRDYLQQHGITDYTFRAFSTAPAQAYGLLERDIPTDAEVKVQPFHGVIVIGKSVLHYPTSQYEWLKRLTPTDVLGHSMNVYDLR
ncbi:MAG: phospholipid carrier-dependent glycosyltransferase [Candidatus Kerfeldbacteria bacterium]|nr:phospholipid carrier-dependent glycosyltransferase [Candidatus Kerfeldbacteria bacterium]